MNSPVLLGFLFCYCILTQIGAKGQSVQCIDGLREADQHGWSGMYHKNANTPDDLPDPLTGKFKDGRRIIYYEGRRSADTLSNSITSPDLPAYLYVKYYAHIPSNITRKMYVFPTTDEDFKPTYNFEWAEALVHLEGDFRNGVSLPTFSQISKTCF